MSQQCDNFPSAAKRIEVLLANKEDRPAKKMRRAGIRPREEANRFLEEYLATFNLRFMKDGSGL
jgi:hypothetical protein